MVGRAVGRDRHCFAALLLLLLILQIAAARVRGMSLVVVLIKMASAFLGFAVSAMVAGLAVTAIYGFLGLHGPCGPAVIPAGVFAGAIGCLVIGRRRAPSVEIVRRLLKPLAGPARIAIAAAVHWSAFVLVALLGFVWLSHPGCAVNQHMRF